MEAFSGPPGLFVAFPSRRSGSEGSKTPREAGVFPQGLFTFVRVQIVRNASPTRACELSEPM